MRRFVFISMLSMTGGLSAPACGDDSGGGGQACTPGEQVACACPGGGVGVQQCTFDGDGFDFCQCGGGDGSGGGTATDTGDTDPDPMTSGATGTNGGMDTTGTGSGTGSAGCDGNAVFAMLIPNVTSVWTSGMLTGIAAGHEMCQAMGADHVCDYEEVLAAEEAGELAAIMAGTTAWLHRTTTAEDSAPGPGGRCVEWTYGSNDLADGEFVQFGAGGTVTYNIDDDTIYDPMAAAPNPHVQVGLLECGGVTRSIMCCNECLDG